MSLYVIMTIFQKINGDKMKQNKKLESEFEQWWEKNIEYFESISPIIDSNEKCFRIAGKAYMDGYQQGRIIGMNQIAETLSP